MIAKLVSHFRKHEFDMDNYITTEFELEYEQYALETYICKKCGKSLCLHGWQMKCLPWSMSHGCPGKKK